MAELHHAPDCATRRSPGVFDCTCGVSGVPRVRRDVPAGPDRPEPPPVEKPPPDLESRASRAGVFAMYRSVARRPKKGTKARKHTGRKGCPLCAPMECRRAR